jgi:FKBP-type peptidyl-prolyl cis-trans isomerase FklB
MKTATIGFIGLFFLSGLCTAAEKKELKSDTEKINYSVGYQIGGDFKSQGVELDPDALVQGVQDAISHNKPLLSPEQMNATLVALKKKILADQQRADKEASAAFLVTNAKQKGVTVLPSGVQYKVLKEGSGKRPTLKDEVKVHYRITRVDGKELGSTYVGGKPRTYSVAKAIPALQEVLPLMTEGAKWQVVIPPTAQKGSRDRDPLDDMGVLIYELELISVKTAK